MEETIMIGQRKRDFNVVPYQSSWKDEFEREADLLRTTIGEKALCIEHHGSTAIPGMRAKAIIDIMMGVNSLAQAAELIPLLEEIGYEYRPKDEIPDRMYFRKESLPGIRTHHLSLTPLNSRFWKNQLAFRDYLRRHDRTAAEYINLKVRLAEAYARTHKIDPEGKTEFVARVLELARKEETG